MSIINYFFEKHIERCKKELENFENNKFKDIREDLKAEAKQYINGAKNFFGSIDAENYSDFNKFNGMIKTFNDELNRIMKASANISTLVYVIQNVSEDDFYTYTDFISSFSYNENKFNNASKRDIKYLKLLDKYLQKINDDFEVYKERGDLKAELGLYNEAIDDYKKALELNPNYDEAKNALEEIKSLCNNETYIENSNINNINNDNTGNQKLKEVIVKNNNIYSQYLEKANEYAENRQYEYALREYDKCIELNPENLEPYKRKTDILLLNIYNENGNGYKQAIKCFNDYIKINAGNIEAYLCKANIYKLMGDNAPQLRYDNVKDKYYADALNCMKQYIEINPNDLENYYSTMGNFCDTILISLNYQNKDIFNFIISCYNECININQNKLEYYVLKANMYVKLCINNSKMYYGNNPKDHKSILDCYNKYFEQNSQNIDMNFYIEKGNSFKEIGDSYNLYKGYSGSIKKCYAIASNCYKKYLTKYPNNSVCQNKINEINNSIAQLNK